MSWYETVSMSRELTEKDGMGSMEDLQHAGFKPAIGPLGQVGIAVATISPVAGVFVNIPGALATGGTGMFWAYLIAAVITFGLAFTYSEMGSIYPVTGGLYSIVRNVLGPYLGFIALMDYLIQAVLMPATIALGAGQYFQALMPSVSLNLIGFIVMLIVLMVALGSITLEAKFTGFFVALELILMLAVTVSSIVHIHQPLSIYTHPVAFVNKHTVASTWSMIIATTAIALFSYNGYDSALNISEEIKGSAKQIGLGAVKAAGLAIVFQVIPIFFMLLAAPSITGLLGSDNPLGNLGVALFGPAAGVIFNVAAGLAILNCTLGVTIQFSRILFASARDHVWPKVIDDSLTKIHVRTGSPYIAVLVVGIIGLVMTIFSSFLFDLTFIGVILVVLYILVTASAIVSKIRDRSIERPYKAPFGFLFPVLGLIGAIIVLTQQSGSDVLTTAVLLAIGVVYWAAFGKGYAVRTDGTKINM